jgi:quercetin 2,3-dioxygenase
MERRTFLAAGAAAMGSLTSQQLGSASLSTPSAETAAAAGAPAMNLTIRRANDRGHADHGWLDTRHTFSFADYFDPAHMGFRALRVINEDFVRAGAGFPTHPHRDMEIFSYVVAGAIEHKDSMGNGRVLRPGEIQLMSAGTGVTHSEFNPSKKERLHLLQIWFLPNRRGLKPGYTEWKPTATSEQQKDVVVISPDGRDGSAVIHQDVIVRRLRLGAGDKVAHTIADGRAMWVQIVRGEFAVGAHTLAAGDGASSEAPGALELVAAAPAEALLFDLGPFPAR